MFMGLGEGDVKGMSRLDSYADARARSPGRGGGADRTAGGRRIVTSATVVDLEELIEEAIPFMAADLRSARQTRKMTTSRAAKQAKLDIGRYRALERGGMVRNQTNFDKLLSAAQRLGLASVRVSFAEEVGQYISIDLSAEKRLTMFVDALEVDIAELKEQSYFLTPHSVLTLLEEIGFNSTIDSRKAVDKQLVELWIGAVFTLCLGGGKDYYVGLAKDDPPDVEVLEFERDSGIVSGLRVEISQYGRWSVNLFDVIGKKLTKRYQDGTVLVVLVEYAANFPVPELEQFIRENNPHGQEIFVMGGGAEPGHFKIVPWDEVSTDTAGGIGWLEMVVETKNASKGHLGYKGVVFRPPGTQFLRARPVFVREMNLHR